MTVASLLLTGAAAGGAQAAVADDEPFEVHLDFTTGAVSVEYGESWYLEAHGENVSYLLFGNFTPSGSMTGTPSGYTPVVGAYAPDSMSTNAFMVPSSTGHSLPPGAYTATLTLTTESGGNSWTTPTPAQLTITPASLAIALQVAADPSNPANAIVSARFTGAFADRFFSTVDASGPLTPAGTWTIKIAGEDGEVAHEFSAQRTETDDVLAVSSYWSDVPPGTYTARATFVPSGDSADNFAITDAAPVTFTAAAAPGSGSTAPPAPPAPPATEAVGMTLPLWVPIAAGVVAAGLLALLIVQIVRLRRIGAPTAAREVTA